MALVNPYCTAAQVKGEIRNDEDDISVEIEAAINSASRWIDTYKGRDYFLHDHTTTELEIDQFDARIDGANLWLPFTPIIQINSVEVAGEEWTVDEDFIVKEDRLIAVGTFDSPLNNVLGLWPLIGATDKVIINGKFGYAQASSAAVPTGLPQAINRAAILIAANFTGHNSRETVGLDGSKTSVLDKSIPKVALDILGSPKIVL